MTEAVAQRLRAAEIAAVTGAEDLLSLAESASMPDTYYQTDQRILRAVATLRRYSPDHRMLKRFRSDV